MRAGWLVVLAACSSPSARALDAAPSPKDTLAHGDAPFDPPPIDAPLTDAPLTDSLAVDAANLVDAALPDAMIAVDAATGTIVHVTGVVDGLAGAHVTAGSLTATTDGGGNLAFDVASGTTLIMRATTGDTTHLPMLRGVVAQAGLRTRHFDLETTAQLSAMSALGVSFDPAKAIVMIDFRHAQNGGYGAKLTQGAGVVTPPFGVADSGGDYVLATTTQTAFVTTLLLANLPPGETKIEPLIPSFATLPCQQRDAQPLPLEAGSVTWIDFECGTDRSP